MSSDKITVVFIGCLGRSGSTLLDRTLGSLDGFFSIGELRHIWDRSFVENQLCGCGQPFSSCEFWNGVVDDAFGGFSNVDIDSIIQLKNSVEGKRHIPQLVLGSGDTAFNRRLDSYAAILGNIYKAIQKRSGCNIIIDSSKNPLHAFILQRIKDIDVYVVHLLRDSRAVAFSWQRDKLRPEIHWKKEYMKKHGIMRSCLWWNIISLLTRVAGKKNNRYLAVRYEDFISNPGKEISRLLKFITGEQRTDFDRIKGRNVQLSLSHTVAGNPMRFHNGWLELKLDDEWTRKMSAGPKIGVTALTLFGLLRYGYINLSARSGKP